MIGKPNRPGFHTITPYMMVQDVDSVVDFLKGAFGASERFRTTGGAGGTHVEVQVGDSMLMLGGGNDTVQEQRPVALFLYVEDVDAVYQRALGAGASSLMEPAAGLFGEAMGAGVQDPFGNEWYLGKHDEAGADGTKRERAGEQREANGEFEVRLQPLDSFAQGSEGTSLGRMSIEKTFRGDLEATSRGEMLTAMTDVEGSAGYVAVEQVEGSLDGKRGSFVLQHSGIRRADESWLFLEVVPDSGTGELATLSGKMQIRMEGEQHFYTFDYSLR